jgi:hypothetical protein
MQRTTRRDLNCNIKLAKNNQLIPQDVDGYCNFRRFLTTIGARSRTDTGETTIGIFYADALIMV